MRSKLFHRTRVRNIIISTRNQMPIGSGNCIIKCFGVFNVFELFLDGLLRWNTP